ncbi:MAG: pirin family protein [Myxococcota bacterium]
MTAQTTIREVARTVTAHRQTEGGGFIVRRPLPTGGLIAFDPFLLLDEMGPIDYAPGEALGAPDHPHRGFETVSYILEGELEHEDSAGHRGALRSGDVQWMTAGGGIIHSEMPSRRMQTEGGRVHGFQIWVNLPARLKLTRPRYQEVPGAKIPVAQSPDGKARGKIVAGQAFDVHAVIDTHTPIVYQDWTLDGGADLTLPLPADHNVLVYAFGGAVTVGERATPIVDGQMALLGPGDAVRLRTADDGHARALVLGGVPLGEPIARYGPFVMNTESEIRQAIRDYQSGKMGEITRTAEVSPG